VEVEGRKVASSTESAQFEHVEISQRRMQDILLKISFTPRPHTPMSSLAEGKEWNFWKKWITYLSA
jgi:hypothetical protein